MTPLDPSDDDWARALEIACQVIQKKLGSTKFYTREMAWTTANEPSGVAEATSNAVTEESDLLRKLSHGPKPAEPEPISLV